MYCSGTDVEYDSAQLKLLEEFMCIPNIDKAWVFKSDAGAQAMFAMSQANLLANKRRKFLLSTHISKESGESVRFHWAPFPIEMFGASPTKLLVWSSSHLEKEFHIPPKVHGFVYVDGWFEGISWNSDETHVAYVAEEPPRSKPTFNHLGCKKGSSLVDDCGSWKGQGYWEEDWGEAYAGKKAACDVLLSMLTGLSTNP